MAKRLHNNPPSLARKFKEHDASLQVSHTNIALLTFSFMQDLRQGESEEESVLMDQSRSSVDMQQEVMDALKVFIQRRIAYVFYVSNCIDRSLISHISVSCVFFLNAEIPASVKCVRHLITTMKRMPPVMDTDSTSSGYSSPAPEMVCFAFIHVLLILPFYYRKHFIQNCCKLL